MVGPDDDEEGDDDPRIELGRLELLKIKIVACTACTE